MRMTQMARFRGHVSLQVPTGTPIYAIGDVQGLYPALLLPLLQDGVISIQLSGTNRTLSVQDLLNELTADELVTLHFPAGGRPTLPSWKITWHKNALVLGLGDLVSGRGYGSLRSIAVADALAAAAAAYMRETTRANEVRYAGFESLIGNHEYCLLPAKQCKKYAPLLAELSEDLDWAKLRMCADIQHPDSHVGRFLAKRPLMVSVGKLLFTHTGHAMGQGRATLAQTFEAEMRRLPVQSDLILKEVVGSQVATGGKEIRDGLLLHRPFWTPQSNSELPRTVDAFYEQMEAETLVIGHARWVLGGPYERRIAAGSFGGASQPSFIKMDSGLDRFLRAYSTEDKRELAVWSTDWALRCVFDARTGACDREGWRVLTRRAYPEIQNLAADQFVWGALAHASDELDWGVYVEADMSAARPESWSRR